MSAGRQGRPRGGMVCCIFQQKLRTYHTTDLDSMPALATLSALSTTISGLVQIAGQVVDLLDSAKSISLVPKRNGQTKPGKDQAIDASQLANAFAAFLAAAAHPSTGPINSSKTTTNAAAVPISTSKTSPQAAAPRTTLDTSNKSVTSVSPSVTPLTVLLAAGPTTAITMATVVRSVPATTNSLASRSTRTTALAHKAAPAIVPTAPAASHSAAATARVANAPRSPATVPSVSAAPPSAAIATSQAKTLPTPAIAHSVATVPHSPIIVPTVTMASHPSLAHPAAAVGITPPSANATELSRTTSRSAEKLQEALHSPAASAKPTRPPAPSPGATPTIVPQQAKQQPAAPVVNSSVPSKVTQTVSNSPSSQRTASPNVEKPIAPGTIQTSAQKTPSESPVLALYDVPLLNLPDSPLPNGTSNSLRPARMEASEITASSVHEASPHEALGRSESLHSPEGPERVAAVQTKYLGWADSTRSIAAPSVVLKDWTLTPVHDDSGSKTPSVQAASPPAATPPMTVVGTVSPPAGINTPAAPSDSQPNGSPAEQLSRALVAQAAIVNHEGRSDFHLRLQPPQLGNVQIHLTARDHTISARVIVSQEGTQQLIEGQAHQLRQSLAESGLVLGNFDVRRDGGGSSQGGRHQQPELPQPPSFRPASPTATAVVKASRIVSADGIDILA